MAEALRVTLAGMGDREPMPERYASCVPDGRGESRRGENIRPAIGWSDAPRGTQSYAIIMVDNDVPQSFDDANQHDRTIPAELPRREFYHWLQADIPAKVTELPEGRAGRQGRKRHAGYQRV